MNGGVVVGTGVGGSLGLHDLAFKYVSPMAPWVTAIGLFAVILVVVIGIWLHRRDWDEMRRSRRARRDRHRQAAPKRDDWRRQGQERYMAGVRLFERAYRPTGPASEHDHCEFCGARFSSLEGDLHTGYSTEDGNRWVCASCFDDFRDEFQWHGTLAPR